MGALQSIMSLLCMFLKFKFLLLLLDMQFSTVSIEVVAKASIKEKLIPSGSSWGIQHI